MKKVWIFVLLIVFVSSFLPGDFRSQSCQSYYDQKQDRVPPQALKFLGEFRSQFLEECLEEWGIGEFYFPNLKRKKRYEFYYVAIRHNTEDDYSQDPRYRIYIRFYVDLGPYFDGGRKYVFDKLLDYMHPFVYSYVGPNEIAILAPDYIVWDYTYYSDKISEATQILKTELKFIKEMEPIKVLGVVLK